MQAYQPYTPPPPRRRRVHPAAIVVPIVAVGGLVAAGVVAYAVTREQKVTIKGSVTISKNVDGGKSCHGVDGFDDMQAGASVVVHDPAGKVIATGELGEGVGGNFATSQIALRCQFPFTVAGVPRQKFYGIEVSHRGTVDFTAQQIRDGEVALSLGS